MKGRPVYSADGYELARMRRETEGVGCRSLRFRVENFFTSDEIAAMTPEQKRAIGWVLRHAYMNGVNDFIDVLKARAKRS